MVIPRPDDLADIIARVHRQSPSTWSDLPLRRGENVAAILPPPPSSTVPFQIASSLPSTVPLQYAASLLRPPTPAEPTEDVTLPLPQLPIEIICIIFKSVIKNETYDEASGDFADSARYWIETEKPMFNITMIEKIAGLNQSWLLFVLDCVLHERKILKRKKLSTGLTGSGVCGHGIVWQNYSEGGGEYQRRCLKCAACAEILRHRRTVEHCTHLAGKLLLVNKDYSRVEAEAKRLASLSRDNLGFLERDSTPFGLVYRSPAIKMVPGHELEEIVKKYTGESKP